MGIPLFIGGKPFGSGTNDFPIDSEYENFREMFALILAHNTPSNFIKKAQEAQAEGIISVPSNEDVSGDDEEKNTHLASQKTNN